MLRRLDRDTGGCRADSGCRLVQTASVHMVLQDHGGLVRLGFLGLNDELASVGRRLMRMSLRGHLWLLRVRVINQGRNLGLFFHEHSLAFEISF